MSTEPVNVYKIPRLDKDDDPMPDFISYIPLKHLDEIKTQGATLRQVGTIICLYYGGLYIVMKQ